MRTLSPAILLLPIFFSCRVPRYAYAPARVNAPLFQQKNEIQMNGSIAVLNGLDGSGAYAFTSHFGAMLNGYAQNDWNGGNDYGYLHPQKIEYRRRAIDLGAGVYSQIDSTQMHVELFAGVGTGKFSLEENGKIYHPNGTDSSYSRNYKCNLQRVFIQPAFGISSSNLQLIFFTRFMFQRFHQVKTDYAANEIIDYLIPESSGRFYSFIEPGLTFRAFFKGLNGFGLEFNWLLSHNPQSKLDSRGIHMSVGIHYRR
jgi:hypothetical protein